MGPTPLDSYISIPVGAPWSGFTPYIILPHSSFTFCTPLVHSALCIFITSHFLVALLFFNTIHHIAFQSPFDSLLANISINHWLNNTHWAKYNWNSISPTCSAGIIRIYNWRLWILGAIDELSISAFCGDDEMGDLVDEYNPVFDWYQSMA